MSTEFTAFPKIARLSRDCIITEKIDGTNAQILIDEAGEIVGVGSRNRWLQPGKQNDNFGFAGWAEQNKEELRKLGPGRHFGEWWGVGIQREYGLTERRFSLFKPPKHMTDKPSCVSFVPVLFEGLFTTGAVEAALRELTAHGSYAAPGFMDPEGIVIFHKASGQLFKKTVKGDEAPKGKSNG